MIPARPLAEVMLVEGRTCLWPGCPTFVKGTWCDLHGKRVARGWEPGCETAWERVMAAFARLLDADTEDDEKYRRLEHAAKREMMIYRQARRRSGR